MTAAPEPLADPVLNERAAHDLRYIRSTMERAGAFTAVSGLGYTLMGASALLATLAAARTNTPREWLLVWLVELAAAAVIAVFAMAHKARRLSVPLASGPGRKLVLGFAPVMGAGGAITFALVRAGADSLLPGTWLAIYGAGVIAGGLYSIRPVPIMGGAFLVLGIATMLFPALSGNLMLALGFGVLHIAWGILIIRRYGG